MGLVANAVALGHGIALELLGHGAGVSLDDPFHLPRLAADFRSLGGALAAVLGSLGFAFTADALENRLLHLGRIVQAAQANVLNVDAVFRLGPLLLGAEKTRVQVF